MRKDWIASILLVLVGCGAPSGSPGDASSPDGGVRDAMMSADAGPLPCPTDLEAADGTACARAGGVCESAACGSSACDPACVRIECESTPDGARWARRLDTACADAGALDAGPLDGGPPAACESLDGVRDSTVHAFGASGTVTSIVWDGTRYALVWHALTSSEPVRFSLFFALADREGNVVPGSVRRIFDTPEHESFGALAVGDSELGLAFIRGSADGLTVNNRAWFARLDRDGAPITGTAIRLSDEHPSHHGVTIAWSAERREWAVVWGGTVPIGGGYVNHHAYLSRVDAAGAVLAPNAVQLDELASTVSPGEAPSLVWTGDRWAIALAEYVEVGDTQVAIAEIDPESATVSRRIVVHEGERPNRAALATDGTMYGVAWMEIVSSAPSQNEMHFGRAMVGGDAVGENLLLGEPELSSGEPSLSFDGATFRLAFNEGGSVWLARIARDGTLLGTPGALFTGTPPYSPFPFIATDGCNDAIAWTAILEGSPQRAEARLHLVPGPG